VLSFANGISWDLALQELKNKLLFSVVVLAFRSVVQSINSLKAQVKRTLQVLCSSEYTYILLYYTVNGVLYNTGLHCTSQNFTALH
jgi:hypothetical protein